MERLFELTLLTASYNTPAHTLTMLRSFVSVHGDIGAPYKLIVMENSTNEETAKLLTENNVKYVRNPGGRHSQSIDKLIDLCRTRYALLLDTDIVFQQPIYKLLEVMEMNDGTLLGESGGDRGGYRLYMRVHPWFCFINVSNVKKHNIKWHDQERIDRTGSAPFYANPPLNPAQGNTSPFYDNGATFYEDVNRAGLKIINANGIRKYFKHYEGSSWHMKSGHLGFIKLGTDIYNLFKEEVPKYKDVDIKDKFKWD